jgi:glucose/arabinose dehydrogenase
LRNPWRYSFDSQTGDLWVGDVQQDNFEEIDVVKGGDNLGWPIMEGERCYGSSSGDLTGLTLPVDVYNHVSGDCSVTGGYVYRGQSIPALQGHYIHGDFCTGTVRTVVKEADESYSSALVVNSGLNIASFAQGADSEVLAVALSGQIYKFIDDGATSNIPAKLSDSGRLSSTQSKSCPDYVVPYDVFSK